MAQSSKVLVLVNTPNNRVEAYVEGVRRGCFYITTEKVDMNSGTPKLYEVEEKDLNTIITQLTTFNPGVEVVAYKPCLSGIRPAGEMVIKEISKDGELPA
jgi:hypothetical protein